MQKVSNGEFVVDFLSRLIVLSGIDWRKVRLLKSLTRYLHQTGIPYGKAYIKHTLVKHYKYTEKLLDYFAAKHDPNNYSKKLAETLSKEMKIYLDSVASSTEDKVLQNMFGTIDAILRTNFYQTKNGEFKKYLSFKFDSKKVPDLPLPKPHAEIFVYSNNFEGIHLRGGKVARGGLRG